MTFKSTPPHLVQIAALWSLWDYPTARTELSLEKKLTAVKASGFDGVAGAMTPKIGRLVEKHGLCAVGYISSGKAADFRRLILENRDGGARRINVQLADHDTPVDKATALALRIVGLGEQLGCPCDIEVHRDTCTETPEKAYAIAAAFQKATGKLLPMTWDFSHFSVVKHLAQPYWERLLIAPGLVQHSRHFHFRPFNGHHCQIPVTDGTGQLSLELRQWLPFLEKTIGLILSARTACGDYFVCPEMGPVRGGYNFAQLPNSWEDAQVLRPLIEKTWGKALAMKTR